MIIKELNILRLPNVENIFSKIEVIKSSIKSKISIKDEKGTIIRFYGYNIIMEQNLIRVFSERVPAPTRIFYV